MKLLGVLVLVLASAPLWAQAVTSAAVNPDAGRYPAPLIVTVTPPAGSSVRYRYLETPSTQSFAWSDPVVLDALPGETRVWTLRVTTTLSTGETLSRDVRYTVSRAAPAEPAVQPVPGYYTAAVTPRVTMPEGWTLSEAGRPWSGTLDAAAGSRSVRTLEAQGPQGQNRSWTYTVDKRDQEAVALDLVSPIAGAWGNAQTLVVTFRGVDAVQWSYGDHLDRAAARAYTGPVALEGVGKLTVTVGGRSRVDGTWREKTVSWTQGSQPTPTAGWPVSGVQSQGLTLPAAAGWSLSWDEGKSWQASSARQEAPSTQSRKVLTLQARKEGVTSRFVYWLDARAPATPELQFVGGWNPLVVFSGSEALHKVLWTLADGRTEESAGLWGPVGAWKVPDDAVAARVSVQGANGAAGTPAVLGFARTGWVVPEWEPWDQKGPQTDRSLLPLGGRVLPRPGFQAVFELASSPSVSEPGVTSPVLDGALLPAVPWGSDRTFYARFAWRDASGLTGPATSAYALRVDRVPPLAPDVVEAGGQVIVKPADGEEEGTTLAWAVTSERVPSADALAFQSYTGALDAAALKSGAGGKLWLHAQARDRSGNTGPARLNVALAAAIATGAVVQVDPDPSVGETPVEDGGVYAWAQFRLRALEAGKDLWVGVTDKVGSAPDDWKTRLQPWTGIFSRSVGRGERRTFLVFWNARTKDGWEWPAPKTLTLTLDQGAPATPTVAAWPATPLGSAWTLTLQPGRTGDSLRYTATTDGSEPADPLARGTPWPGTLTWDTPPGSRTLVRVRFAALSVSGIGFELPRGDTVVIDKTVPAVVVPALDPFTYRSGPVTVALPAGSGTVRYALTSDGSVPPSPTASSPAVPRTGLPLDGVAGQSVLYRFRWRTYSAAGLPASPSDVFAVLVDRSTARPPESVADPETAVPGPRLLGVPASGVSSQPVLLTADWPAGVLRYELREGTGSPRPVTAQSSPFSGPLVLDGGPGVDRSYAVSVRGFSVDGTPLTDEEQVLVRIDRAVPLAPNYSLALDPRRPEASVLRTDAERNPEETLEYRWFWDAFPSGSGQSDWKSYTSVPVFAAPSGALTRLRVQAFLRDEAGNEGPVTERAILVDQNVVYVAPKAAGDGTRSKPLGGLSEALDLGRRTGRGLVFLASGPYTVSRTADLGGFQVYGGWSPELWEATPSPGRSTLTAAAPFAGSSLVESGDRPWALTRVDLSTGTIALAHAAVVRGAEVSIRSSVWSWSAGWDQVGGTLNLTEVTATYAPNGTGSLLDVRNGVVNIRGLGVSATGSAAVILSFRETKTLVQDLTVLSKRAKGFDALLSVAGGSLTVDKARLLGGDGSTRATGLVFKDATVTLYNMDLSLFAGTANTGLQASGGRVEMQKSSIALLAGEEFNQGLVLDGASAVLQDLVVKIETGSYQGGFSIDGGELEVGAARVRVAGGGQQTWGARFLGSTLVHFEDVTWERSAKTPGQLWSLAQPWVDGSTVTGNQTVGW